MEMHDLRDEDIESTLGERRRIGEGEYAWFDTITGGNYASSMQEATLYRHAPPENFPQQVF